MMPKVAALVGVALSLALTIASPSSAQTTQIGGWVLATQGHENPACITIKFRRSTDNAILYFRLTANGVQNGILATSLTAVTTKLFVVLSYDPSVTSGCGTEPKVTWMEIQSN